MTSTPSDPVRLTLRGSEGIVLVADRWLPDVRTPVRTLVF